MAKHEDFDVEGKPVNEEDEKCPLTGEPPVKVWPSCVRRCGLIWRGWEDVMKLDDQKDWLMGG